MTINLDGIQSSIDPSKVFSRAYNNMKTHHSAMAQAHANGASPSGYNSAPPTAHAHCPTCGKSISDPLMLYNSALDLDSTPLGSSPLVVPMGPLAAAAFESGMSAVEELRLLKAQVQDVARVCNAVARGDLSQKITVPVQGVVMVQLKDVINTMVRDPQIYTFCPPHTSSCRSTNWVNLRRKSHVYPRKSERKGEFLVYVNFLDPAVCRNPLLVFAITFPIVQINSARSTSITPLPIMGMDGLP